MILEMKQVRKSFGKEQTYVEALKPVDFSIDKGKLVAIIGPSGSGKSTLLTIAGLLQGPTEGEIIINGKDVSSFSEKKRSKVRLNEIGFILQASNLVPFLKVKDQFKLLDKVKKDHMSEGELKHELEHLGLSKVLNQLPNELSGGQRQRVAILKALYTNPSIILADEPTASLDGEKAIEVIKLLREEVKSKDKAGIVVTHDHRLLEYFDEIYEMNDGKLTRK
ncbi:MULTISPECIES: ABC transporter ATP-binding protein [Macrococcus]|uniref:ABC transporter ATP-binding protein n=1 Tax=Macrococcus psychrotolerans TaxID=3039389 RepID=A0AAT9P4T9_9STAP|nr:MULTISPECIES: ABC transporter ATP-binding protein [Macrococcus]MDJ1111758.1 ABC transporter ATP-binding protein [Macrococcus sp. S115]QYA32981.1 ABC transporter ATP-binding protein [Macrococcus sp. 19Msa1099]QYA37792.1 ABC transporter ATP-binding protein [Macrococcus caseolyticus]QYA76499.1 ABC transporter ATP-binding protein [Macrococcus caseolyticus]